MIEAPSLSRSDRLLHSAHIYSWFQYASPVGRVFRPISDRAWIALGTWLFKELFHAKLVRAACSRAAWARRSCNIGSNCQAFVRALAVGQTAPSSDSPRTKGHLLRDATIDANVDLRCVRYLVASAHHLQFYPCSRVGRTSEHNRLGILVISCNIGDAIVRWRLAGPRRKRRAINVQC